MIKLIRITSVPISLKILLKGQLKYFNQFFEVSAISSPGEELLEVQKSEGVKVLPVNITRRISPVQDIISLYRLIVIFKKEKPNIVHTHTPKAGTIGMIAAWLCKIPVRMHTVAGLPLLETTGIKRQLLSIVEKITYACATGVYPNSNILKTIILQNKYCREYKLKVIGNGSSNGIDTSYFSCLQIDSVMLMELKNKVSIKSDDFVFIFIGRLVKDKGINELAKAFVKVQQQYPAVKLLLVGNLESDLDPLSLETIKIITTHPSIILAGYQNDVRPWLAISNALVFPSYREGFPNVVLQAGSMGLPSIVTDINGCSEIIIDGHNGIIIPPKRVDALHKAMINIVEDTKLRIHLAENARERIVTLYEQQYLWSLIKEEYEKQLEGAGIKYITKSHVPVND